MNSGIWPLISNFSVPKNVELCKRSAVLLQQCKSELPLLNRFDKLSKEYIDLHWPWQFFFNAFDICHKRLKILIQRRNMFQFLLRKKKQQKRLFFVYISRTSPKIVKGWNQVIAFSSFGCLSR